MPFPRITLPSRPPNPLNSLRNIVKEGRQGVERAVAEIRSLANDLRGGIPQEPKKETETPQGSSRETATKTEEECPVCSELTNLKEYIGKRKVARALSELEKSGDKENVETIKKYIEGEDVV